MKPKIQVWFRRRNSLANKVTLRSCNHQCFLECHHQEYFETPNQPIFFNLPTSTGRLPFNEFCDKFNSGDKEGRLKICEGIDPLSLLHEKLKYYKYWQFPILGGIFPSNIFSDNTSWTNRVRSPKKVCITPDSLFAPKLNVCIFWNFSKVVGIVPIKWLDSKSKRIKLMKFLKPQEWFHISDYYLDMIHEVELTNFLRS